MSFGDFYSSDTKIILMSFFLLRPFSTPVFRRCWRKITQQNCLFGFICHWRNLCSPFQSLKVSNFCLLDLLLMASKKQQITFLGGGGGAKFFASDGEICERKTGFSAAVQLMVSSARENKNFVNFFHRTYSSFAYDIISCHSSPF